MVDNFLAWLNKFSLRFLLLIAVVIGAIFMIVGFSVNHHHYQQYEKQRTALLTKRHYYADKLNNTNVSTYYTDAKGKTDSNTVKATAQIASKFALMTTYSNGKEYEAHRKTLQSIVKDQAFFNNFYKSDRDSNGKSSVDVLNQASETRRIRVYKVNNNEYHVLLEYVSYGDADNATPSRISALSSQYLYLDVKGEVNNFSSINVIQGVKLNNQQ